MVAVPIIKYNSFDLADKQPFGAVQRQVTVSFQLTVQSPAVQSVHLQVVQDGHWHTETSLAMRQSGDRYQASFTPSVAGLYFYYFIVQTTAQTWYYGCVDGGYGGQGIVTTTRDAVQMYQLTCLQMIEDVPTWYQNAIFYHIFVDRFNNGNSGKVINTPKANSFIYGQSTDLPLYIRDAQQNILRWDFYGGNLKGIEQKLPYLQQLGITALFLSPIFQATSNHRYDTGDYFQIDEVLGSLADFDHLLMTVHQLGMHLILDGVFNHVGADSRYFNLYHSYDEIGAVQSPKSPYYSWFSFIKYPSEYDSWWGVQDLPTVNKENSSYQQFIYGGPDSVIDYWTKRGVDGWRLDVADELPDPFIQGIRRAADHYAERVLIGEVWEDASHKIAYGQRRHYLEGGMLQATMNYPLRQLIISAVTGKLAAVDWWRQLLTLQENYPASAFRNALNNIGTHDTERILTMVDGDAQLLTAAVWLLLTLPGTPCIYYGDEAGLVGGKDPANRAFYPWQQINQQTFELYQQAIAWRKAHQWINQAAFVPFYADQVIGYTYYQNQQQVTCMLNLSGQAQTLKLAEINATNLPAAQQAHLFGSKGTVTLTAHQFRTY